MSYVSPFTGDVVQQTDVTYYQLNFSEDVQLFWPLVVNPTQVPAARIMDCIPDGENLVIRLPNALQGANGTDIFIRNKGAVTFYVEDFDGNLSESVAFGEVKYFYLSDNTTTAGVWQSILFGAGTSSADAAALAGPGLAAIAGRLAVTDNIVEVSATPTLTEANRATTYVWTGGNGTLALPSVSGLNAGWFIAFRNNGSGNLAITPPVGSQINNTASLTAAPGNSGYIIFKQDTGNFFTVGVSQPSNVTLSSATYDVDAVSGPTLNLASFAPTIQTYVALSGTRTTDINVLLPGTTQLYVVLNSTGTAVYNLTFQITGSAQVPVIIPNGTAATILCDAGIIYVLTQVAVNNFYAQNGSASAPPFTFTNDITTGMYLPGSGILGLTANGIEMLNIDNSNTAVPVISTIAEFDAKLIAGGTF